MVKGLIDPHHGEGSAQQPGDLSAGEKSQAELVSDRQQTPADNAHQYHEEELASPASSTSEAISQQTNSSPTPTSSASSSGPSNSPSSEQREIGAFSLPLPPFQIVSRSVEELNELALQDSENNNVDENSNDQQYDQYANYHQEYSQHQFVTDQSVRPRTRVSPAVDETDHIPLQYEYVRRRNSSTSHRRNQSEDLSWSSSSRQTFEYPPLPNTNVSSDYNQGDRLPRLPGPQEPWDNHPSSHNQVDLPRNRWLPVSLRSGRHGQQPPPTQESVRREAEELLFNFTSDTLQRHHLPVPEIDFMYRGFSNTTMSRTGQELRQLADAFASTEERKRVRCMAEGVNMESINMENFFQLCAELFSGGITRERIVALFTFVGDVAVYQVRYRGEQFLTVVLKWSLKYLVDYICKWVQDAGGWGVVLSEGVNLLYKSVVIMCCLVGTIAGGIYIWKHFKEM